MRTAVLLVSLLAAPATSLDLPFKHPKTGYSVEVVEGSRGLGDAFPYLAFRGHREERSRELIPANAGDMLLTRLKASGKWTDPILGERHALAATRLFVAGILVQDEKRAEQLIATARVLSKELKHLPVKVTEFRPKSWAPKVERTKEGWTVTLVAFEMDRILQLVQITAKVPGSGKLVIEREPIVTGPMTVWQSAVIHGQDADMQIARLKAMDAEALLARRRYAKSLQAPRTLDTAWAIARLRLTPEQIDDLWPGPKQVPVANRLYSMMALEDGSWVAYTAGESGGTITDMRQTKKPTNGRDLGEVIRVLAAR
ncbi:MAG: hypothetical protein ACYS0E_12225 [Planctomycetota bacterium]|jgi:hypothetical protein